MSDAGISEASYFKRFGYDFVGNFNYGPTWFSFFKKSLLCISRHILSVIQKAFLLPTRLDLSGHACLWIASAYPSTWTTYHLAPLVFHCQTTPFVVGSLGSQIYRNFSCDGFLLF